jgi:hypothetical protein
MENEGPSGDEQPVGTTSDGEKTGGGPGTWPVHSADARSTDELISDIQRDMNELNVQRSPEEGNPASFTMAPLPSDDDGEPIGDSL